MPCEVYGPDKVIKSTQPCPTAANVYATKWERYKCDTWRCSWTAARFNLSPCTCWARCKKRQTATNSWWSWLMYIPGSQELCQPRKQAWHIWSPPCATIWSYHTRYQPPCFKIMTRNSYESSLRPSASPWVEARHKFAIPPRKMDKQNTIIGCWSWDWAIKLLSTSVTGIFSFTRSCTRTTPRPISRHRGPLSVWYFGDI